MEQLEDQVVVVGAGPVGMTAAALLAAHGVPVTVLERNATTSDAPKAISLDDESLRIFQSAGLVDRILRVIVPGTGTRYYGASGTPIFQARAAFPFRFGYPFKNPFAQPNLERELMAHLMEHPLVTVRTSTIVHDVRQSTEDVEVLFGPAGEPGDGGSGSVRASYVLGCDGGRSTARARAGIGMTGRNYAEPWLVADVLGDPHDQRYGMHHGDPDRPHVIVPGRGGRCRYEFLLHPGEGTPEEEPGFPLVQRLLAPFRPITEDQIERAVIYRFNALVADRWSADRIHLLGDAAHMMPPFAGQGLNSGIRDAANLCWKIAAVLEGQLEPSSLTTYEQERRPHAEATVRLSERLGRIVMTTNRRFAERRDRYLTGVLRDSTARAFYEEMRYRPPHIYTSGLLIGSGENAGPAGVMIGQPRAFNTAAGRTMLLDEAVGAGWGLFGVGVARAELDAAFEIVAPLRPGMALVSIDERVPYDGAECLVDVDGRLDEEFAGYHGQIVLVRPDHFVAAAWRPGHMPSLAGLQLAPAPVPQLSLHTG